MKARGARRLGRLVDGDPSEVGRYRLVGRVGDGGMGVVYAGTADGVTGYLAIKVIHAEHAARDEFRRNFAHEARLLARVNSPCVARFVQADVEADPPWIATEYVPGPTVRHHVERHGALRGGMLLGLAVGAADALRAIHAAGIVHRDLKPSNVVISPTGPKVLDFGIARPTAGEDPTRWMRVRRLRRRLQELRGAEQPDVSGTDHATQPARDRVGTPGWISPEQYRGRPATDRSDVFLWGCLIAFAAAAHDPFGHGHPKEMARRVVAEDPDLAGLTPAMEKLVLAAMAKDPADRPDSGVLLDRALALAADDAVADPPRPTSAQRAVAVRSLLKETWTDVSIRLPQPARDWSGLLGLKSET
ncbi:serine/threonine-protein kinase [Nocardiopsis mangrovi]|uniref:Serine/threonine-protein kinase n=1 Tax=Nocardiopsis mangrovi TaxID=1179818 RepID=A0ABV9DRU8_9ACTN